MGKKKQPEEPAWVPPQVRRAQRSAAKIQPLVTEAPRLTLSNEELEQQLIFWAGFDIRRLYDTEGRLLPVSELDEYTARMLSGIKVFDEYEGRGEERTLVGYTKEFSFEKRLEAVKLIMKLRGLDGEMKAKEKDRLGEIVEAMKQGPVKVK